MSTLSRIRSRLRLRPTADSFGLDVGSTAIKVVELRAVSSSYEVARCAVVPLPRGVVSEGAIHEPEAVVEAIRAAVTTAGITRTGAAVGLCGRELIIKKLQIPEVPLRELGDVVRIEAEHEIPFAIEDVALDYHVIGQHDHVLDLALVAAKRAKVMEYSSVITAAGLVPVVVDVDGFALGNQFQLNPRPGLITVVDVGATITKMSVVRDGLTQFVRDVPIGGHRCTQAIAAQLGIPVDVAEAIKIDFHRSPEAVSQACRAMSRDLALEIQRTLDYFSAGGVPSDHVLGISLVGGGAELTGLPGYLATALDLPVDVARPCDRLAVAPACAATVNRAGPALALALGLSLRQPRDGARS